MPRDVNGNFTLVAGNPVTAGTTIEADWANTTLADIAAALTDSLSRSGLGGLLAALKFEDGTEMNPGMSWTNEPTSGWLRAAFNDFWFSVGNDNVFQITKDGVALAAGKTASGFPSITGGDIGASAFTMGTGAILGRDTAGTGAIEELSYEDVADLIDPFLPEASTFSHGECRLARTGTTTLLLSRFSGLGGLLIDGEMEQVPDAGVSVTNGGLAANTTYFVYAFMSGPTMTLEVVATAPTDDDGVQIKTGDATRTLVGMVRTNASSQFTAFLTRTWFHDGGIGGGPSFIAPAAPNYDTAPILAWAGEPITVNTFVEQNGGVSTVAGNWAMQTTFVDINAGVAPTDSSAVQPYCPAGTAITNGVQGLSVAALASGAFKIRIIANFEVSASLGQIEARVLLGGSGA